MGGVWVAMHFAIFLIVGLVSCIPEEKSIFWCSWAKLKQLIKKKKKEWNFPSELDCKGLWCEEDLPNSAQAKRDVVAKFWLTHFAMMPVHKHSWFWQDDMWCGMGLWWIFVYTIEHVRINCLQIPGREGFGCVEEILEQYLAAWFCFHVSLSRVEWTINCIRNSAITPLSIFPAWLGVHSYT